MGPMPDRYRLEISHREQFFAFALDQEVGLGRQLTPAEPLGKLYSHAGSGEDRIAIAPFSEVRISRRQLLVRPTAGGIAVVNPSTNPVFIDDTTELAPNGQWLFAREGRIAFGPGKSYSVRVWLDQSHAELHTLPHVAPKPGRTSAHRPSDVLAQLDLPAEGAAAVRARLSTIIEVLQGAAASADFLERAARAVVELVGLDTAHVLLLEEGQWRSKAEHHRHPSAAVAPFSASRRLLERMRAERRTVWSDGQGAASGDFSQAGVLAVVCAPICNHSGAVIGALYADRQSPISAPLTIGPAEAMFAETLAYVIAVGLERWNKEQEAVNQRVLFEQFFSRELAEQLAANPAILTGKDALVTMLAADIRDFSAISERLGAQKSLEWIQDTLNELTAIVMQHGGVVVDYIGDAVLAMWGAPVEQPDQARRACQAALDMQVALGPLNARWRDQLGAEIELAIGIHTGLAQVGNVGSRRKFKYGALGPTVNLASRVQGANKHLRSSLLITQATHDALGSGLLTRRIGGIQVINIEQPVEVYELRLIDDERGRILCQLYEKALAEFEAQQFRRAARTLGDYIPNYEDDGPSHILLWRAVNGLVHPAPQFDPAWRLPGK
jgi:adenylate cyclase